MERQAYEKATIQLEPNSWHGYETESIWVERIGKGVYVVRNVPFYAMGVSHEDVVRVEEQAGVATVTGVIERGGHSTYRFIIPQGIGEETWLAYWTPIERLGCTYERATDRIFAVDVPPASDIYQVYSLLEQGENAGAWEFEEGHCGHPLK